jgi:hypothetical protein
MVLQALIRDQVMNFTEILPDQTHVIKQQNEFQIKQEHFQETQNKRRRQSQDLQITKRPNHNTKH